jgi:S1-C subfamily serine protease
MNKKIRHGKARRIATPALISIVAVAFVIGSLVGGILGYSMTLHEINQLQNQVSNLQNQESYDAYENITYYNIGENISLSNLYENVKDSVVVIYGVVAQATFFGTQYTQVQGSGFVYDMNGRDVIVTNFHVVNGATNITVTFSDGNSYSATVLGSDAYADLAALSTEAPENELKSIQIASSSTLKVGEPVVAIGSPFGLVGSMTAGIVSQLGRTINESTMGTFSVANIIQTSTPINPGNSGGPLLNYLGQVVGITAAIVSNSQGLGFAIPSDTILREIGSLVEKGSYTQHSWLGISGADMDYEIAKAMGTDVTYGLLLTQVVSGGPADKAGLRAGTEQLQTSTGTVTIGGDIVIAIDGVRIVNSDALLSYIEANTLPGQTIDVTILRDNKTMNIPVVLGTRPSPS